MKDEVTSSILVNGSKGLNPKGVGKTGVFPWQESSESSNAENRRVSEALACSVLVNGSKLDEKAFFP